MANQTEKKTIRGSRGFTLLLAALVASIVLALGSSIFQLAQKGLTLSSIGRDSQFAFYAADSAAECALYWDIRFQHFLVPPATVTCDSQTVGVTASGVSATEIESSGVPVTVTEGVYAYEYAANGYCVDVTVTKRLDEADAMRTVIHADGFSTSCETITTNPRALQRSVELHY